MTFQAISYDPAVYEATRKQLELERKGQEKKKKDEEKKDKKEKEKKVQLQLMVIPNRKLQKTSLRSSVSILEGEQHSSSSIGKKSKHASVYVPKKELRYQPMLFERTETNLQHSEKERQYLALLSETEKAALGIPSSISGASTSVDSGNSAVSILGIHLMR